MVGDIVVVEVHVLQGLSFAVVMWDVFVLKASIVWVRVVVAVL